MEANPDKFNYQKVIIYLFIIYNINRTMQWYIYLKNSFNFKILL